MSRHALSDLDPNSKAIAESSREIAEADVERIRLRQASRGVLDRYDRLTITERDARYTTVIHTWVLEHS